MTNTKCGTCTSSIYCSTFGEIKCTALKMRIYNFEAVAGCKYHTPRGKNFKEPKCQCEDCLRRDEYDVEVE